MSKKKKTWEVLLTITDDGFDDDGAQLYLSKVEIEAAIVLDLVAGLEVTKIDAREVYGGD